MTISIEALVMIVGAFVAATLWIVTAINGVQRSIDKLGTVFEERHNKHEDRISALEGEVWQGK
jgi:hypothetical protein